MPKVPALLLPVLLAASAGPGRAAAQEAPEAWRLQLELGFNGASGNRSFAILRTGAKLVHLRTDVAEFELSTLVRYGKSEGELMADDQRVSFKLDLWPQATWSPFAFVDASRDVIRKLDFRSNGGAGLKWSFWQGETGKASLSSALIWDYQDFRLEPLSTEDEIESLARWSFRAKGEKTVGQGTTFEHTTFWQPAWDRAEDYILTATTSVSTKVLGDVSLSLEHEYLRDSDPPPGVGPDDQKFSVLLKLTL